MRRHNLYGDIHEEHRRLIEELLEMEDYFENKAGIEPSLVCKGFCCIAHDYYAMGDDEKGSELLAKANKIYPGYFDSKINDHIDQDPLYKELINSLTLIILQTARSITDGAKNGN